MKTTPSALAEMINLPKDGKFYTFDISALNGILPNHFENDRCGHLVCEVKEWKNVMIKERPNGQTSIEYQADVLLNKEFDYVPDYFINGKVRRIIFEYIISNYKF